MDVILVHRMLKNDVPVSEYLLMTDAVHEPIQPSQTAGPGARASSSRAWAASTTLITSTCTRKGESLAPLAPKLSRRLWNVAMEVRTPFAIRVTSRSPCGGFQRRDKDTPANSCLPSPHLSETGQPRLGAGRDLVRRTSTVDMLPKLWALVRAICWPTRTPLLIVRFTGQGVTTSWRCEACGGDRGPAPEPVAICSACHHIGWVGSRPRRGIQGRPELRTWETARFEHRAPPPALADRTKALTASARPPVRGVVVRMGCARRRGSG